MSRILSAVIVLCFLFSACLIFCGDSIDDLINSSGLDIEQKSKTGYPGLKYTVGFDVADCTNVEDLPSNEQGWRLADMAVGQALRNSLVLVNGKKFNVHTYARIPVKGKYKIWVRYSVKIGEAGNPFDVSAEQNSKIIFNRTYFNYEIKKGGYGKDIEKEYNVSLDYDVTREGVVSGEQFLWEGFVTEMDSGTAEIRISAMNKEKRGLKLDCVMITKSLEYKPSIADFTMLWARFRTKKIQPAGLKFHAGINILSHWGHGDDNWWYKTIESILNEDGEEMSEGEFSRWIDLTKYYDKGKEFYTTSFYVDSKKQPASVSAEVQFAWGPSEEKVFITMDEEIEGRIFGLVTPNNNVHSIDTIWTGMRSSAYLNIFERISDQAKRHYETALKFNIKPDGTARFFTFSAGAGGYGKYFSSKKILDYEMSVLQIMGVNAGGCGLDDYNTKYGIDNNRKFAGRGDNPLIMVYGKKGMADGCPNAPIVDVKLKEYFENQASALKKEDPEISSHISSYLLADEPAAIKGIDHVGNCSYCIPVFREYLKKNNLTPADFGKKNWDRVLPTGLDEAEGRRAKLLYYWTMKFICYNSAIFYKKTSDHIEKAFGKPQPTYVNFSPHPFLFGTGMGTIDWFEMGRLRGTNVGWTEDWMSRGSWGFAGIQLVGYLCEMLSCAGRTNEIPIGMYVIGQCGDPNFKTLTAVGRGAKKISYSTYGPTYAGTEMYYSDTPKIVEEIARTTPLIKRSEDVLFFAKPRKVPAAILYARTNDFWTTLRTINVERRLLYLALQHDQIPCNVIIEDDVDNGALSNYRVLYVIDGNIKSSVQEKIRDWVKGGGILWACSGAGEKDEINAKCRILNEVFGIESQTVVKKNVSHEFELTSAEVLDTITFSKSELFESMDFQCLGYLSKIKNKNGKPLALFSDGSPAVVFHEYGKGKSMLVGTLPGLTYFREASNDSGDIFDRIRVGYRKKERDVITKAFEISGIKKPVEVSREIVEAMSLECETGVSVVLVNYTMKDIEELLVRVNDVGKAERVYSSEKNAGIPFRQEGNDVTFALPLNHSDIVNIYRK